MLKFNKLLITMLDMVFIYHLEEKRYFGQKSSFDLNLVLGLLRQMRLTFLFVARLHICHFNNPTVRNIAL